VAGGNVRVGVAYIDVRLGELKQFWGKLKREVEKNGPQVGKQLGDEVTKRLSVSKKDFAGLTKAISGAIEESGVDARRLKDVLRETGRQGGDAFLREFTPLLRASLAKSGIEGRERLLEAFEAGDINPRLVRTFQQALGSALEGVDTTAGDGGSRAGNAFASAFNRGVSRVSEGLGAFSQRLGLLSFQVTNLGVTLSAAFTAPVAALTALAGAVGVKSATIIEDATVAFTTLLGTQDKANAFLLTLRGFANTSPIFDLDNVIQFSRNLLGAGVRADGIIPTLTALSSIAAAYGLDQEQLNRALRGFTQSLLLGRVYQEELNQITEAGIPIYDLLAKAFGKTKQEIQELVSNKEISPEELFNQIVKLGNSGQFLEGLEQRAGTLTGVWAQFKETLQSNLADALTPQLPRIKEFLRTIDESLRDVLANSGPFFDAVLDTVEGIVRGIEILSDAYAGLTPDQREFVNQIILLASAAGPAVIAAGALAGAVSTLASGVAFVIGLLATPLGAAVVAAGIAIGGLAALFKEAYDNSEDFRATIDAIVQTAKDIKAELQPRLTELAAVVLGLLAPAFDAIREIVVEKVLPALRDFAETVGPKVVTVVREISEVALPVLIFAFQFFAAVIEQQVIPAMNQLIDVYRNNEEQLKPLVEATLLFAQVSGTILVVALGGVIIAVSIVIAYYAFLVRVIAIVVDWILRIGRALGDLRNTLTTTGQAIVGLGGAFQRAVAVALQQIGALLAAARGLPGRIAAAVGSLGGLLYQAGIDLIQGLINGVNARAEGLLGRLRGLAQSASAIFGGIFQFGSPSKLTYQWGQWIVQGLEEGMSDAASTLAAPTPLTNLANLRIDEPDAPIAAPAGITGADLVRALQGVAVVLDGRLVGRIEGRRADLLYRGR
jgi:tape measure domain-containing protein